MTQSILVIHPGVDYGLRYRVVAERFFENLLTTVELAPEDAVGPMGFVDRSPLVFDRRAELIGGVLILETLDSIPFRTSEQETDHHVVEASVDEVIDDGSKFWLTAKLFEQAHLVGDPGSM